MSRHYSDTLLGFESTHTLALARIAPGSRVLDIGCAGGHLCGVLRERRCHVTGMDRLPVAGRAELNRFEQGDLNASPLPLDLTGFHYAVMLDVIEHLASPERFVDGFVAASERNPGLTLVVSTGNVAFVVTRLMLLAGWFNYGKRGILDLTHTRLFTFATFRRLFEQAGCRVVDMRGVPAPFPLALGDTWLARGLLRLNRVLLHVSRPPFAYQIFAVIQMPPGLASLLDRAERESGRRSAASPGAGVA